MKVSKVVTISHRPQTPSPVTMAPVSRDGHSFITRSISRSRRDLDIDLTSLVRAFGHAGLRFGYPLLHLFQSAQP